MIRNGQSHAALQVRMVKGRQTVAFFSALLVAGGASPTAVESADRYRVAKAEVSVVCPSQLGVASRREPRH